MLGRADFEQHIAPLLHQRLGSDHFTDDEPGPEPVRKIPERQVAHARHGSERDRVGELDETDGQRG